MRAIWSGELGSSKAAEFTGERIVPGLVDINLLAEHVSRYAFAAQWAGGKRVLDAGCGSGYGAAELAKTAREVTGIDCSEDALAYAREHHRAGNLRFERGSCAALPFDDGALDLVTAFEVIEHLDDWAAFPGEAKRVLAPAGVFIVSTPNRLYYAESRRAVGPNPFHVHEFEFEEFREALREFFPHVTLFAQNHAEGVVFAPFDSIGAARIAIGESDARPEESHFFIALCGARPVPTGGVFVYLPGAANLLREREHHIAKLEGELELKSGWLEQTKRELAALQAEHVKQEEALEKSNRWAASLQAEGERRGRRILDLQDELAREQEGVRETIAGYEEKIAEMDRENREKTEWALETERRLTAELGERDRELAKCVGLLDTAERTVEERTLWAQRAQAEADERARVLAAGRSSRWVKLGRRLGLGPAL